MGISFNAMHTTLMAVKKQSELEVGKRSVGMEPLLSHSLPNSLLLSPPSSSVPSFPSLPFPTFIYVPSLSHLI